MLLLLAFVVSRALVGVVAHEDESRLMPQTVDLAPLRRARRDDDVRAFLLPAAVDPTVEAMLDADDSVTDATDASDASAP